MVLQQFIAAGEWSASGAAPGVSKLATLPPPSQRMVTGSEEGVHGTRERLSSVAAAVLAALPADGTSVGNARLRGHLGLDAPAYRTAVGELQTAGLVRTGRGRGGTLARLGVAAPQTTRAKRKVRGGEPTRGSVPAMTEEAKTSPTGQRGPATANASPAKTDIYDIADRLWETADELRANSHLKASEYSIPVLGLIFLKFADSRFAQAEAELAGSSSGRREIGKANYQAKGVLYLPEHARFRNLLLLNEGENLGKAINDAMVAIEEENPSLKGVLPRTYQALTNTTLVSLLRSVSAILGNVEGDAFGKVYEYFLGKFAVAEGAKGGEYFTPTSIVRLIVEIIEPFHGKILDPGVGPVACSSRAPASSSSTATGTAAASPYTARRGWTRLSVCAR